MPSTRHSEAALERRREKLEYAASFPGMLRDWAACEGKTVERVAGTPGAPVVVFTDGTFLLAQPGAPKAEEALAALESAREALRAHHPEALAELDRRAAAEKEAMRLARMEKVLGAVESNLPRVPELRDELRRLLERE
jgi:hypothetical protein